MDDKSQQTSQSDWYGLWMEQYQVFLDTGNKYLKSCFVENETINPETHLNEIQEWLQALREKWQTQPGMTVPPGQEAYWESMQKVFSEAADWMVSEWRRRANEQNPLTSIKELYVLWLTGCQEIQRKWLRTKQYQDMYGDMLNMAMQYWQTR